MQSKSIHPFINKVGDSINNQPNENGPNSKLKALYNISKAECILKYGTVRFQPHHMNSVLVETLEAFMVSDGNIIRYRFAKTCLLPLSPPKMITNTKACVASIQTSSRGINQIAEDTLAPIKLLTTRTNGPMVILQRKGSTRQTSRNILLREVSYDTLRKQTALPLQDIKREFMMILKQNKVKLEN